MVRFSCSTKTDREILEKIDREEVKSVRSELHMSWSMDTNDNVNARLSCHGGKEALSRIDVLESSNKILINDNEMMKSNIGILVAEQGKLLVRLENLESKFKMTSATALGADNKAEQLMKLNVELQGKVGDIIRANKDADLALEQILAQCGRTDKKIQHVDVCLDRLVKGSTKGRMDAMCDDLEKKMAKLTDLVPTVKERIERMKDALESSFKYTMSKKHSELFTELKGCVQNMEARLVISMGTVATQARDDMEMLTVRVRALTGKFASGEGSSKKVGKKRMHLSSDDEMHALSTSEEDNSKDT